MLVLTRKVGEEIVIGDNIRITVVEVGPGRVKIGVAAPRDVRVDREEIRSMKDAEPAQVRGQERPDERTQEGVHVPTILHNRISAHIDPAPAPASTPVSTGPRTAAIHNRLKAYRPRPAKV